MTAKCSKCLTELPDANPYAGNVMCNACNESQGVLYAYDARLKQTFAYRTEAELLSTTGSPTHFLVTSASWHSQAQVTAWLDSLGIDDMCPFCGELWIRAEGRCAFCNSKVGHKQTLT